MTLTCYMCNESKPRAAFYPAARSPNRLSRRCPACEQAIIRDRLSTAASRKQSTDQKQPDARRFG